jgi:hypothetical protein
MILPPVLSSVRAEIRHLSGGFEKTPSEYDCNRARLAGAARLESVAEYRTVRDQSVAMPDILQPVWATTVAPCSSQNNIASTAATHTPLPQRVISGGYRIATATIARHKEFRDEYTLACELPPSWRRSQLRPCSPDHVPRRRHDRRPGATQME